jgi:hypothetical protein
LLVNGTDRSVANLRIMRVIHGDELITSAC